jgi:hypothetical protein
MADQTLRVVLVGQTTLLADLALLAEAAKGSLEVREALVYFLHGAVETAGVDIQCCSTTLAGELRVEAKLPNRLASLAAALRAIDRDGL